MERYIEQLINEDVEEITDSVAKKRRTRSLYAYYSSPNYCRQCGKMIVVNKSMKVCEVRKKKFCNHSCSATYTNQFAQKGRLKSFVELCNEEDFIAAYNESCNYVQLGCAIGYSFVNSEISKKIKLRMKRLGLEEYKSHVEEPIDCRTKEDLINNSSNWQSWRSSIQKKARATYRSSDKPKSCVVCGYDKTYEVAHIRPVSDFNNDTTISEINHIDNLIALCPNHHWEFDNSKLNLDEYLL